MILRRATGHRGVTAVLAAALTVVAVLASPMPAAARPAARPTVGGLEQQIATAAHRLEVVVEEYNDAREDLRGTVARARDLDARLPPMTQALRDHQRRLGGLVAETYQHTRSGPTIALLAAATPHQFVGRLLILNQLATDQRRAVTDLSVARDRVAAAQHSVDLLAAHQRRLRAQLNARRAAVEGEIAVLRSLRREAMGGGSRFAEQVDLPAPPYVAGPAGAAVAFAYRQIGKPYRWGASGPGSYDCSGLTSSAWAAAGQRLPHNARRQYASTAHLNRADLRPGDLIFYYGRISHVAMYVGDGTMIHAPEYGERVRLDRIDLEPIHGYGRPG